MTQCYIYNGLNRKGGHMTPEEQFRVELKNTIFNADPKIDRKELLTDIFKSYVAKLFELVLGRNKDKKQGRIEFDAMITIKRNLINEFRQTDLAEYQRSEEQYAELFELTVQEILNDAALAHQGEDILSIAKELPINDSAFIKSGNLFVPQTSVTPAT